MIAASVSMMLTCVFSPCVASTGSFVCLENDGAPERRHVLLQSMQIKGRVSLNMGDDVVWSAVKSSKGIGATAPLTDTGYRAVGETCCDLAMLEFMYRLIEDLGLVVCHSGGVAGLAIWYNCGNTSSLETLKSNLLTSQPPELCAIAAPAGQCPALDPSCQGHFDPNAFKECADSKSTASGATNAKASKVQVTTTLSKTTTVKAPAAPPPTLPTTTSSTTSTTNAAAPQLSTPRPQLTTTTEALCTTWVSRSHAGFDSWCQQTCTGPISLQPAATCPSPAWSASGCKCADS